MARIFWDTNIFIYLFEDHPHHAPAVAELYERMLARDDALLTSWLTVGEVLTKPRRAGDAALERSYQTFFDSDEVTLVGFAAAAAQRFVQIRAMATVSPADAMQLACAAAARVDVFVTNDKRLQRLAVPGITFIAGLDRTA